MTRQADPRQDDAYLRGVVMEPGRLAPLAFVAGLPGSGNRTLCKALQMCGVDAWVTHGVDPDINHPAAYRRSAEVIFEAERPGRTSVILITRNTAFQKRSGARHRWVPVENQGEWLTRILEPVYILGLPMCSVSYEGFVEHPQEHMLMLCRFLGLAYPAVDLSWVHDGNAKHRRR